MTINDLHSHIELYGYATEHRYMMRDGRMSDWYRHYNHKVYKTLEIANEAISYYPKFMNQHEFRVMPLFRLKEL